MTWLVDFCGYEGDCWVRRFSEGLHMGQVESCAEVGWGRGGTGGRG